VFLVASLRYEEQRTGQCIGVFQQMTRALGLDLLTEEQALQLEELCPEK
jgi:hypothetical protein